MGLIDEILQGIPTNSLLREKVTKLDADKAAAEAENAGLKDDLRHAQTEIASLKNQIEKLTHKENLDEMELEFLKAISAHDSLTADAIAETFKVNLQRVRFHLEKLVDVKYINSFSAFGESPIHTLTHKGRSYLVQNGLL